MEKDSELLSRIDLDKLADVTTLQDKLMAVQEGLPTISFQPLEFMNGEIGQLSAPGDKGAVYITVGEEIGILNSDTNVDFSYGTSDHKRKHKIEISDGYDEITHNDQDGNEQKFKTHLVRNTEYNESGEVIRTAYFVALRSVKEHTMWLDFVHVGGVIFDGNRINDVFVMQKPEEQNPRATFEDGNVGLALEVRHYRETNEIKDVEVCPDLELMADELLRAIEELKPKN